MKYFKNKKFNIPKFLFIFVGLLFCVGALYIQKTLSYFYTSYGFANTFQTPESGSVEIYRKCTLPEVYLGGEVENEFHIANTSEGSRYVRVAYAKMQETDLLTDHDKNNNGYTIVSDKWNTTEGIRGSEYGIYENEYLINSEKWAESAPWYYYKTPLAPKTDIQIYDGFFIGGNQPADHESYIFFNNDFIVETLPTTVSDEEFQNAWGVSKSELGLS